MSFIDHPAEKEGIISIQHSIDKPSDSKTISFDNVRYLLIDPHGSPQLPSPEEVRKYLPSDDELLDQYLHLEKDTGVPELTAEVLRLVPGGLAVNVNFSRGIIDANRTPEFALRKIVSPDTPEQVRKILYRIHGDALAAIDKIIESLPASIKLLCLHSMETNKRPAFEPDSHQADDVSTYIKVFEESVGTLPETAVCLLTGPENEENLGDFSMRDAIANALGEVGIASKENDPYWTARNRHKTTDYMLARPGNTLAVDFPKDRLNFGSAKDRSFNYIKSKADPVKINMIGKILKEAFARVGI